MYFSIYEYLTQQLDFWSEKLCVFLCIYLVKNYPFASGENTEPDYPHPCDYMGMKRIELF